MHRPAQRLHLKSWTSECHVVHLVSDVYLITKSAMIVKAHLYRMNVVNSI